MAQKCPCVKTKEGRTHMLGECETHMEARDVLEEEMREIDERDMEKLSKLGESEKTLS